MKRLLKPITDTTPVHVCWNNKHGNPTHLQAVEFTDDCEVCVVETDCLSRLACDPIEVWHHRSADVACREDGSFAIDGDRCFSFTRRRRYTGNIYWDSIWMPLDEVARFVEYLQGADWWTLTCALSEIYARWGGLGGREFVEILRKMSD